MSSLLEHIYQAAFELKDRIIHILSMLYLCTYKRSLVLENIRESGS